MILLFVELYKLKDVGERNKLRGFKRECVWEG